MIEEKDKIESNLLLLDEYRKNLDVAKQIKKKFLDELENDPEYQECCKIVSELNETIEKLMEQIKSDSVAYYLQSLKSDQNTEKSLFGGNVKIRNNTVAIISDPNRARCWAKEFAPSMLILDEKTLIKHAIAVADTLPLAFVDIKNETVATIASEIKF